MYSENIHDINMWFYMLVDSVVGRCEEEKWELITLKSSARWHHLTTLEKPPGTHTQFQRSFREQMDHHSQQPHLPQVDLFGFGRCSHLSLSSHQGSHFWLAHISRFDLVQVSHFDLGRGSHFCLSQVSHFCLGQVSHVDFGQVSHFDLDDIPTAIARASHSLRSFHWPSSTSSQHARKR